MLLSILFMADALSAVIVEEPIGPRSEAIEPVSPRSMIRLHQLGNAEPSVKIEELAWLEGTWIGRMPNGLVEHVILGPKAGQMPSFVRALNDNDVWFYEISVFSEDAGTVVSRVKHFTPELAGWEAQNGFVERRLVEKDAANLYFDGLTISRTGPDSFIVYFLERDGSKEGQTLVLPFNRKFASVGAARNLDGNFKRRR